LVRAHYPLLEVACLEAGYPREVGAEQANELRSEEMKHAAVITKGHHPMPSYSPVDQRDHSIIRESNTRTVIFGF
jgi:hypothetical protein